MRHVNELGPAKFRTGTENDKEQICYYNYNKKDLGLLIALWLLENKHRQML